MGAVITVNSELEQALAQLAGISNYDVGTLQVDLVNLTGSTTVRFTVHADVPSDQLLSAVIEASQQALTEITAPTSDSTQAADAAAPPASS